MNGEYQPYSAGEIAQGILDSGRTPEQFMGMLGVVISGIGNGSINEQITCWDHKVRWFEMARRIFVDNGEVMMRDAELGLHEAQCDAPTCLQLQRAYFDRLKGTTEEDSGVIAKFLAQFATDLVTGRRLPSLEETSCNLYDSDTGRTLKIARAVDITHHTRMSEGEQGLLLYTKPKRGVRVDITERDIDGGGSSVGYFLGSSIFTPCDRVFLRQADTMKIDPQILFEIVNANAPTQARPRSKKIII